MSYDPTIDFLGLERQLASGIALARMPGLDYVLAALARAGLIRLSVGQTAPIVNQPAMAWFKPSLPSWVAEGTLFLWDSITGQYELATPALWSAFLAGSSGSSGYVFQSAPSSLNITIVGTSLLAVQRVAPATTAIVLPNLVSQWSTKRALQIVDFSTGVLNHAITLTTPDGTTIMQRTSWQLRSTADQLTGITLQPSPELNSWVITP